jgi:hypothetical protein
MATASGALIAESLRVGATVEGVSLTVDKIVRADVGDVAAGQPALWTFIEFRVESDQIDRWIDTLTTALEERGGWYCDFRSADETFVVFAGKAFRYPRGDAGGRSLAADHARSVGVPEGQIDWPE